MRSSPASACNCFIRPFFWGRKPSKQKRSHGNPLCTSAGISAVAPGSVSTSIPASTHVRTNRNPGSEMPGVPASDTRAALRPAAIAPATISTVACSLNLWCERSFCSMPRCFSRNDVVRVSSARMKSTSRRTFTARSVMSSRFPIGVGTI